MEGRGSNRPKGLMGILVIYKFRKKGKLNGTFIFDPLSNPLNVTFCFYVCLFVCSFVQLLETSSCFKMCFFTGLNLAKILAKLCRSLVSSLGLRSICLYACMPVYTQEGSADVCLMYCGGDRGQWGQLSKSLPRKV